MRAYCENQQIEGYENLLTIKPIGMSDADFQTIKTKCEKDWDDDFNMRAYCEKQQVKGWESTQ